ncbi:MAG: hypothetical protein AABY33_03975 [Pseudomonadota bacterium]
MEKYLNNVGFRSIGRVLGVLFQLVHHWVRKAGDMVEEEAGRRHTRHISNML